MKTGTNKCAVCGKEFKYDMGKRGPVPRYCSDECRRKAHIKTNTKSMTKRYHEDDEWRKKRVRQNAESNRRRREARREQVMQGLINDIMKAKTPEEVRSILEDRVKIKASLYNARIV